MDTFGFLNEIEAFPKKCISSGSAAAVEKAAVDILVIVERRNTSRL